MSRLALQDRLRTIVLTAVLTSVGWLAFGGGIIDGLGSIAVLRKVDGAPSKSRPASEEQLRPGRPAPQAVVGDYMVPVAGVRADQLTDTFTQARAGGERLHDAIDIMAPRGTPVLAATAGTVEKLFTSNAGGLTVYVRSPDRRTITYYAHLDAYARGLAENQRVKQGQPLGTVGFTGNASPDGPHLHFAIMQTSPRAKWWEPTVAVNPYPVLTGRAR